MISFCSQNISWLHWLHGSASQEDNNRFVCYQGDITNCQAMSVRWLVVLLKSLEKPINMEIIYLALRALEADWDRTELASTETEYLGQSFSLFIDVSMERVKTLLLSPSNKARANLEYILRCLGFLSEMKAFSCCFLCFLRIESTPNSFRDIQSFVTTPLW